MLCCFSCLAQGSTGAMPPPEMADHLRSSGKIYVVVLTLALILAGVLTYLIKLDVKVKNLENEHSEGAK
ncbi:MAG: CcmD family protein [Bacteroidota bacterium]